MCDEGYLTEKEQNILMKVKKLEYKKRCMTVGVCWRCGEDLEFDEEDAICSGCNMRCADYGYYA